MNIGYVYFCLRVVISTKSFSVTRTFFVMQIYVYLFLYGHSNFLSYKPKSPKRGFPITVEKELNNLLFKNPMIEYISVFRNWVLYTFPWEKMHSSDCFNVCTGL